MTMSSVAGTFGPLHGNGHPSRRLVVRPGDHVDRRFRLRLGALPGSAFTITGSPTNGFLATAEANFALNSPYVRCSDVCR